MRKQQADNVPAGKAWLRQRTRRMMIGMHFPDYDQSPELRDLEKSGRIPTVLSEFDADDLVRRIRDCGAQVFYFYNKCHMGNHYHPTKVPGSHVHSSLGDRDLFGDICEACTKHDIVPATVYEFSDHRVPKDHPDWCHRTRDKISKVETTDALEGTKLAGACLNGPYGDYAIAHAVETIRNYPVRAYYIDFLGLFNFGKWICPYCGPKFAEQFGFEFTTVDDLSHEQRVAYIQWHYRQYDEYTKKLLAAIREVRDDIVFVHNAHLTSDQPNLQTYELARDNCDFMTADLFALRAGWNQFSWKARAFAGCSRNGPAEILNDSEACIGGDYFSKRGFGSYLSEMMMGRALDVMTCGSILTSISGALRDDTFEIAKAGFAHQIPLEPWFENMTTEATVGLVRSQRTIEFRPQESEDVPVSLHGLAVKGWCQVLIRGHALWDIVQDFQLTEDNLSRFQTLVLPDVGCLSDAACETIRGFVANGGRVIATGETSLFDENGRQRPDFALADVLGVSWKGERDPRMNIIDLPEGFLSADSAPWRTADLLVLPLGHVHVAAQPQAHVLAMVREQLVGGVAVTTAMSTDWPAMVQNTFSGGTSWYLAGIPGERYMTGGLDQHKTFMMQLVNTATDETQPVLTDAPETVELFAHRQEGRDRLVVNLVNQVSGVSRSDGSVSQKYSEPGGRLVRFDDVETMPVLGDFEVRFRPVDGRLPQRVYAAPDKETDLPLTRDGNEAVVTVGRLQVHRMLVAEYDAAH